MAQLAERHRELARRLDELLAGAVDAFPELDERIGRAGGVGLSHWRQLASGSHTI